MTLELAETFVISRSARDEEEVVQLRLTCSGVHGYGEAAPIDRYDESPQSALAYIEEHADALGDDPFALEEIMERLPAREFAARAAFDIALARPAGQAARPARVPAARAPPRGTADDVDDLARRSRRHGTARREGRPALQAVEAEARRPRRPRRRARARRAGRDEPADAGRRERGLGAGRGARQPASSSRRSTFSTASSRSPPTRCSATRS